MPTYLRSAARLTANRSVTFPGLLRILFAAMLLVLGALPSVHGEDWLTIEQKRVKDAPSNSEARLIAMLRANLAAYNSSFRLALEMTDESVQLAEQLGNKNALAASLMQRARVKLEHKSPWDSQEDYLRAVTLFDQDCRGEIAVIYWIARAVRDRRLNDPNKLAQFAKEGMSACEELGDPDLKLMLMLMLMQQENGQDSFSDEAFEMLREVGVDSTSWPVRAGLAMAEVFKESSELEPRPLIEFIKTKLPLLKESGIRGAYVSAYEIMAMCHASVGDFEEAMRCSDLALTEARLLESNNVTAHHLLLRGEWAAACGKHELAKKAYNEGLALSLITDLPLLKSNLYGRAIDEYIDNEEWEGLREMMSSTLDRIRLVEEQRKAVQDRNWSVILDSTDAKNQRLVLTSQLLEKSSTVNRRLFRRQRLMRNLGFGILAFLVGALFFNGLRLRGANYRLEEQIEDSRRHRTAREALERRVAQVERMDSLGMLAGGVAHDFNNLLVGVLGNAEVLKMRSDDPMVDECTDSIIRSAQVAAELSQKMLTYAGKRSSDKVVCNLKSLIEEMLPLLRSGLGSTAEIKFETSSKQAYSEVDVSQIEQVLLNLISNAKDSIQEQGKIVIRLGHETIENPEAESGLLGQRTKGGNLVYFEVADNGCGISAAASSRMCEPFFSTKAGGRGLGLSVVYGYVNKHDGFIRCSSVEGKGTAMRILLPSIDREMSVESEGSDSFFTEDSVVESPGRRGRLPARILIVDDERPVIDVVQRYLEKQDCRCATSLGGKDAIAYLESCHEQPNCIVLDLVMVEGDGDEVLDWMIANDVRIPVVVMSGYSLRGLDEYLQHPNVAGVLQKPFSRRRLFAEVQRAFDDGRFSTVEAS